MRREVKPGKISDRASMTAQAAIALRDRSRVVSAEENLGLMGSASAGAAVGSGESRMIARIRLFFRLRVWRLGRSDNDPKSLKAWKSFSSRVTVVSDVERGWGGRKRKALFDADREVRPGKSFAICETCLRY